MIIVQFLIKCRKNKSTVTLWPITKDIERLCIIPISVPQDEKKLHSGSANRGKRVRVHDWFWFYFGLVQVFLSYSKGKQGVITFDAKPLSNYVTFCAF